LNVHALAWLREQLGVTYSYADDLLIGIDQLTPGNLPTTWYDALTNGRSWCCSALADAYLHRAGIDLFPGQPVGAIYPGSYEQPWKDRGWL